MLWHVALITFHASVSEERRSYVAHRLSNLGQECGGEAAGILLFRSGQNVYPRKKCDLVEVIQFRDQAAADAFKKHPAHRAFGDLLTKVADWVVGDIME